MKKQAILFSLMFVLFGVLVSSCSILQQTSSGGGESYFPSAFGNTWFSKSTNGESSIMTVEGMVNIGSITAKRFFTTNFHSSGASTNEVYFKIDSSGVYTHGSDGYVSSIGIPFLAFPLEVGKRWDISVTSTFSTRGSILAKENVTVTAGTFDCYKVRFTNYYGTLETDSTDWWFGNNAGIVKIASSSSTFETVLQWKNF